MDSFNFNSWHGLTAPQKWCPSVLVDFSRGMVGISFLIKGNHHGENQQPNPMQQSVPETRVGHFGKGICSAVVFVSECVCVCVLSTSPYMDLRSHFGGTHHKQSIWATLSKHEHTCTRLTYPQLHTPPELHAPSGRVAGSLRS